MIFSSEQQFLVSTFFFYIFLSFYIWGGGVGLVGHFHSLGIILLFQFIFFTKTHSIYPLSEFTLEIEKEVCQGILFVSSLLYNTIYQGC